MTHAFTCPKGYIQDKPFQTCIPCPANCVECSNFFSCDTCVEGFNFNENSHNCEQGKKVQKENRIRKIRKVKSARVKSAEVKSAEVNMSVKKKKVIKGKVGLRRPRKQKKKKVMMKERMVT
jgi:hypothetical protein